MRTGFVTHNDYLGHVTPPGHPEQIARIAAIQDALAEFELDRHLPASGQEQDILRCHPIGYLDALRAIQTDRGTHAIDGDTFLSEGTLAAAMRGVGGICAALDRVIAGAWSNAFVACRPPGHHAEREKAMGFCFFGNVAIAAKRALDHHGLKRVAVVDFDVHHGNGTQDLLWDETRVLFISSHQMPLFPGTGAPEERGAHRQIHNLPLRPGSDGAVMRALYREQVWPLLNQYQPELILISAGFDAHTADPLGGLDWNEKDFAWLTHGLCDIADTHAGGRVISTLEGGYDLAALGASVAAHVAVLQERAK